MNVKSVHTRVTEACVRARQMMSTLLSTRNTKQSVDEPPPRQPRQPHPAMMLGDVALGIATTGVKMSAPRTLRSGSYWQSECFQVFRFVMCLGGMWRLSGELDAFRGPHCSTATSSLALDLLLQLVPCGARGTRDCCCSSSRCSGRSCLCRRARSWIRRATGARSSAKGGASG